MVLMFMKNNPNDMYIVHITSMHCYVMPIQLGLAIIHVLHFFFVGNADLDESTLPPINQLDLRRSISESYVFNL